MTETKYFCDHCRKELNLQKDREDIGLDLDVCYITADLCLECTNKLTKLVKDFLNKE